MATQPESLIVRHMIEHINQIPNGRAVKVHGGPYTQVGEPDISACVNGRAVKVEAKQPGKRPAPAQVGALRRWQRSGALVGWATSTAELVQILAHVDDYGWQNDLQKPGG